jgi:hypothetical protein
MSSALRCTCALNVPSMCLPSWQMLPTKLYCARTYAPPGFRLACGGAHRWRNWVQFAPSRGLLWIQCAGSFSALRTHGFTLAHTRTLEGTADPSFMTGTGMTSLSSRFFTGKLTMVGFFSTKKLFLVKRLMLRICGDPGAQWLSPRVQG